MDTKGEIKVEVIRQKVAAEEENISVKDEE